MKKVFFIFLIFSSFTLQAQLSSRTIRFNMIPSDSVDFEIISDRPFFYSNGLRAKIGLQAQLYQNPQIVTDISYTRQNNKYYLRMGISGLLPLDNSHQITHSVYRATSLPYNIYAHYTYFFNKVKKRPHKYFLQLGSVEGYTVNPIVDAMQLKGTKGVRFGLDLGLKRGVNYYNLESSNLVATDRKGNIYTKEDNLFTDRHSSTFQDYCNLRMGISYTSISRIVINAEKYGRIHETSGFTISAGLLLGLYNRYDNVHTLLDWPRQINGINFDPENYERIHLLLDLNENSKKTPFGASIKFETIASPESRFNTIFSFEQGILPGEKGNLLKRTYLEIKAGISINRRL